MTGLRVLISRVLDGFLRRRREHRLSEEVQTHLAMLTDEYMARGLSPSDAARQARRAFGAIEQMKASVRDQRGLPLVDATMQDARFAVRLLERDRGFAITAVLVLALGIGVNNMLFAILNGHTLRGLPVPSADRVAFISTLNDRNQDRGLSRAEFDDLLRMTKSFSSLLAVAQGPVIIGGNGEGAAERLDGAFVSADLFTISRGGPVIGRGFVAAEQRPGAAPVALLGAGAWQARYGADASVLGRSITVDGVRTEIVGVMPARSGLPTSAEVWLPLDRFRSAAPGNRADRVLSVFARLLDGVALEHADGEVQLLAGRLSLDHPETNTDVRIRVIPVNERYFGRWTHPAWLGFGLAGMLVVLISAANVANLMLGRMAQRTRELAIRASLGATRRRLVRQLLIEGTVLAAVGCALGLGLAIAGTRAFRAAIPQEALPYWIDYSPDIRVLVALLIVAAGTVLVFALLPAVQASKTDVNHVLKDGGRTGAPRGAQRWTTAFLSAEFALGMVLMAQVSLSFRSERPPLPSDHVLTARDVITAWVTLSGDRYLAPGERRDFHRRLSERLHAVPQLTSASLASAPPLMNAAEAAVQIADIAETPAANLPAARMVIIGPRYFETLGLALVRGRDFAGQEETGENPAVIVNQEFVRRFLPDRDPIGQRVAVRPAAQADTAVRWSTIVGVAPDLRQRPVPDPEPIVYLDYASNPVTTVALLLRSPLDAAGLTSRLKQAVAAIDSELPVYRVRPLADVTWNARWNGRLSHRLILALTLIAVTLSAVGLYAVTMHAVRKRTQEIGVRMALGARPAHVVMTIMRGALVQLSLAFTAGVLCIRLWEGFLPGDPDVSASDIESLLMVAGVLAIIAVTACAVPVRRAIRLDPVAAIRHD